ncbi:IS1 family transposase [Endozoicomonas gorgoniicola]|uniref:IS1 family transposase n=1 Tax=Endozoicomonas gorgoniicola TaxID=1234144 RepID=UPI002AD59517|nr:IS1 family transposase [Endozoicomonas gorgoniicola]
MKAKVIDHAFGRRTGRTLKRLLKRLMRKTICSSRSVDIHDKVIGEFISRKYYQQF